MKDTNLTSINRLSKRILKVMESIISDKNETLNMLIERLESDNDPNPSELYLLESLYQLREKILLTESRINNYIINEQKETLLGNKLDNLYKNTQSKGTSILFD